ncbi:hypothetical protein DRJ48_05535 [Candidatus Woesearchaeota archaeon]|nr:MAG: hypothetical protein DRJ48_05535 [Candidatus Woesearchaeota archaeon]
MNTIFAKLVNVAFKEEMRVRNHLTELNQERGMIQQRLNQLGLKEDACADFLRIKEQGLDDGRAIEKLSTKYGPTYIKQFKGKTLLQLKLLIQNLSTEIHRLKQMKASIDSKMLKLFRELELVSAVIETQDLLKNSEFSKKREEYFDKLESEVEAMLEAHNINH